MIPDGEYTAVVDQIDETLVSLELTDDGERYNLVVGEEELPADGRKVNAVLTVTIVDEQLVEVTLHPGEGEQRREAAQERFDQLSRRPPRDDDADGDTKP